MLSPLMFAVGALIKLTSRGTSSSSRSAWVGHGRPFYMLKFRSMVVNAEELKAKLMALNEQTGPVFKMEQIRASRGSVASSASSASTSCRSSSTSCGAR